MNFDMPERPIRNSAKAIIISDGRILLTKNRDRHGHFYLLPGGGQRHGEPIRDALVRECREEISAAVTPGDLRYVRDYIAKNHEFAEEDHMVHQVEYMFSCSVDDPSAVRNGALPDSMQVAVEWVPLAGLRASRIYPSVLRDLISPSGELTGGVYLGDTN